MAGENRKLQFPFSEIRSVWMNGEQVPFEEAAVSVLTHALHYGSAVFEGIRCYHTARGPEVFRLSEHLGRLLDSARVYRMEIPWSLDDLVEATLETLRANELQRAYIRPLIFRGFATVRMDPTPCPVEVLVAAWPTKGKYLAADVEEEGIDVCVSSWQRPPSNVLPVSAKASGNYLSSQLITLEAHANGFTEGIALDTRGFVSEGPAENLFLVQGETLLTPPLSASILPGITRDAVITLAREMGLEVAERDLPRALLYTCDELFFTGTSVEISPIRSVDRVLVGSGEPGEITRRLMRAYDEIVTGQVADRHGWMTPVSGATPHPSR